ncbi:hypothetical protein L226DRAFT_472479, partial [Lentinus tigrinus ALCF2SS1-7]|uniref:uncharacterized protein n=1 Tax=Lentinus tigrinus ALCF2SS1-7 TaxID=1328758 RepID=UPI00116628E8
IARLRKKWKAAIYGLFSTEIRAEIIDGERCHVFKCSRCGHEVNRFLSTKDRGSTSNLRGHAQGCWGEDVVKRLESTKNFSESRKAAKGFLRTGSLTEYFKSKKGDQIVSYQQQTLTRMETRSVSITRSPWSETYLGI